MTNHVSRTSWRLVGASGTTTGSGSSRAARLGAGTQNCQPGGDGGQDDGGFQPAGGRHPGGGGGQVGGALHSHPSADAIDRSYPATVSLYAYAGSLSARAGTS